MKFSSLAALEILTFSNATSDENFIQITISFQCIPIIMHMVHALLCYTVVI